MSKNSGCSTEEERPNTEGNIYLLDVEGVLDLLPLHRHEMVGPVEQRVHTGIYQRMDRVRDLDPLERTVSERVEEMEENKGVTHLRLKRRRRVDGKTPTHL